jgi:medium-chain acyl-[acyl-carrier-protein] hydrolase
MKGTPSAVLHDQRLMEMLEPTLRADMKLHNEHWDVSDSQVNVPIAALSGELDEIDPPGTMRDWGRYTGAAYSFHSFPGDHFFLHGHEKEVLATISSLLGQTSPGDEHG